MSGGRFNPPDSFPVLYLCETRPCAVAEFTRQGEAQLVGPEGLLPRALYRYQLHLERVLDLTDPSVRHHIGVSVDELTRADWALCQVVGIDAHAAGDQAVRSFSATGVDQILAIFPELVGGGLIEVALAERWNSLTDL